MLSINGKILSRKRTGASAAEQRMITDAIKRSRYLGMLPYVGGSVVLFYYSGIVKGREKKRGPFFLRLRNPFVVQT